jgi:phage gp46-like protein
MAGEQRRQQDEGALMAAVAHRMLDASTRDYVLSGGGLLVDTGFTTKVVLALSTKRGSMLAFPEFGSRMHEVQVADERGRKLAEKYAWQAVAHLESEVDQLEVEASLTPYDPREPVAPGRIYIRVTGKTGATSTTALYTASAGGT